ncbi:MAG TPA: cytochrome b/b6 domain-containing protein [Candidatus Binataceae bacterium]|nr:cytochrome b/b6 domain-containing protein [Candidatus Binataceae bacterium]
MSGRKQAEIINIESDSGEIAERAAYEHPLPIRWCHWLASVSTLILIFSGWQIFWAFPSFGPKIPQHDFIHLPEALMLGGWLAGGLQWHFTFIWIFAVTGAVYVAYQIISGHFRMALFMPKDLPGVWPMIRHYFLFGPKPPQDQPYNPLQKLAYTAAIGLGGLALLSGMVLYNPVQFSLLTRLMGGYRLARVWHFAVMTAFLMFIVGHLVMVALHGWSNFVSILTGWKRNPEYSVSQLPDLPPAEENQTRG